MTKAGFIEGKLMTKAGSWAMDSDRIVEQSFTGDFSQGEAGHSDYNIRVRMITMRSRVIKLRY